MTRSLTYFLLLVLLTGCAAREPRTIRVALCQMRVIHGDPEANMSTALRFCRRAAAAGAKVAVFPETFRLGWAADETERMAMPIPGPATDRLAEAARLYNLYIVAGLAEKTPEGVYNSAVLIGPSGRILAKHRKTWIVSRNVMGVDIYREGDTLEVVRTDIGPVSLQVCADTQRPENLRAAASRGARVVFAPGAWAEKPEKLDDPARFDKDIRFWKDIYGPASRKGRLTIIAVNGVGTMTQSPWKGRELWGASLAYGPDGSLLAIGKRRAEDLIVVDVRIDGRSE